MLPLSHQPIFSIEISASHSAQLPQVTRVLQIDQRDEDFVVGPHVDQGGDNSVPGNLGNVNTVPGRLDPPSGGHLDCAIPVPGRLDPQSGGHLDSVNLLPDHVDQPPGGHLDSVNPVPGHVVSHRRFRRNTLDRLAQQVTQQGGVTFALAALTAILGAVVFLSGADGLVTAYLRCMSSTSLLLAWFWISWQVDSRRETDAMFVGCLKVVLGWQCCPPGLRSWAGKI